MVRPDRTCCRGSHHQCGVRCVKEGKQYGGGERCDPPGPAHPPSAREPKKPLVEHALQQHLLGDDPSDVIVEPLPAGRLQRKGSKPPSRSRKRCRGGRCGQHHRRPARLPTTWREAERPQVVPPAPQNPRHQCHGPSDDREGQPRRSGGSPFRKAPSGDAPDQRQDQHYERGEFEREEARPAPPARHRSEVGAETTKSSSGGEPICPNHFTCSFTRSTTSR